jgi:hypothetical protein
MKFINRSVAVLLTLACTGALWAPINAQTRRSAYGTTKARLTPATIDDPALVQKYQQAITADSLRPDLFYLASDELKGRETGSPGQQLAAEYLAKKYQALGLTPKGTVKGGSGRAWDDYLQHFALYPRTPKELRLDLLANGKPLASSSFSATAHDDLAYYGGGTASNASGEVVFAGYGIADDQLGYNDYAALAAKGVSVEGKWLLMFDGEPMADAKTSLLPTADHKLSIWSTRGLQKGMPLLKIGMPKGILLITDLTPGNPAPFAERSAKASSNLPVIGQLSADEHSPVPPTYNVSAKFANEILGETGQTIEQIKAQIDSSVKPNVFAIPNRQLKATVQPRPAVQTANVVAYLEGSDPRLKDEVVVLSAHYDHLGRNPLLTGDQIFNGAADDGSGTTASLALARAFVRAKREGHGPRRSILFLNTAGEEKGIMGSSYFLNEAPTIPLERMVADINMDGVAGSDLNHPTKSKNYIYVGTPAGLGQDLLAINRQVREATGSTIEVSERDFPSDSVNFGALMIPYLYYSTGLTEHYHKVSDQADTIDYDHFSRVVQLIFATTWQVANQDARIVGVDRSQMVREGYVCRPCGFECDNTVHHEAGSCPVCGMALIPKYVVKKRDPAQ